MMIQSLACVVLIGALSTNAAGFDIRTENGTVLIAADQILAYDWATHTLTLKPGVRKDLFMKLRTGLANGQIFTAAVDGKSVYQGTLTSLVSSASFATPVIVLDEAAYLKDVLQADQV